MNKKCLLCYFTVHVRFVWPSPLHKLQVIGFRGHFLPVASVGPSATSVCSRAKAPAASRRDTTVSLDLTTWLGFAVKRHPLGWGAY